MVEAIFRDLRYGLRTLRRDSGFTVVIVLTLALAIGGNTAIFSAVNAIFFGKLPFFETDRILRLMTSYHQPDGSTATVMIRGRDLNILRQVTTGSHGPFETMVGIEDEDVTLTGMETPQRVRVLHTTSGWTDTMGVRPILGRWFSSNEERLGEQSDVAVIAYDLWMQHFSGEESVIRKTITLDGRSYFIIGVMPKGFRFPYDGDLWLPVISPSDLSRAFCVFARLKPGVSTKTAEAVMQSAAAAVTRQYSNSAVGFGFVEIPLLKNLYDNEERVALALLCISGFFLLLACVNVASLVLARSVSRQREEEIRAALGASRFQQLQRRLVESLLLSSTGSILGICLATSITPWVDLLIPSNISQQLGIKSQPTDWRSLAFTALLGMTATVLCGLIPVLRDRYKNSGSVISHRERTGRTLAERRIMDSFVVLQFTIAFALLSGAGLMIHNFTRLTHRNLGFDAQNLLTMRLAMSAQRYADPSAKRALVRHIVENVEATPGITAAGTTTINPLGGGTWWSPVLPSGKASDPAGTSFVVNHRLITPHLLRAMGIPLLRGRYFNDHDRENTLPVALVSQDAARKFWPGSEAVGKHIRVNRADQPWLTVVGVVANVFDNPDPGAPKETWYLPYDQFADTPAAEQIYLMVRTNGDRLKIQHEVDRAIWRVDPNLAIFENSTMENFYSETLSLDRLSAIIISSVALFGLLLGALGVYGTLSLAAGERTREIGIRMALGAARKGILFLILRHAIKLLVLALSLGLAAAWAVGRLLSSEFAEVSPVDTESLIIATTVLLITASVSVYLPANKASGLDPMQALRQG
jgi:putative ABC transport system permease protein